MSNVEKYKELARKIHEERAKPNNVCDLRLVEKYEEELSQLEAKMKIGKDV